MHKSPILLIDDNKSIRDCLIWVLEEEGYAVNTASNGQEALDFLENRGILPELILLDVMMPILNGWQFREQQHLNHSLKVIPTIILTAKIHWEHNVLHANECFLPKPFDIEELIKLIKEKLANCSAS